MNASDPGHQLSVLKRGKRTIATQIKNDFLRANGAQQLEEILEYFLDVNKLFDFEAADWCRYLVAGGVTFPEFAENVRQYDSAKVCGLVWTANFIAFRCRTCGISPCMSLCPDCFYGANHTGHDFNMFRSHAGGACDCGDVSVMRPEGFCTKHGCNGPSVKRIPADVTNIANALIPKLVVRLVYYLRSKYSEWAADADMFNIEDCDHLLTLLHELTGMGAVMRTIISKAILDESIYAVEFVNPIADQEKSMLKEVKVSCYNSYTKAKEELVAPSPTFYKINICSHSAGRKHHHRCSYKCMTSAAHGPSIDDVIIHKSCIEEVFFWTVKYEFPEKMTTWLLSLLPDDNFKQAFTSTFAHHYTRISTVLAQCQSNEERQRMSNKVVHVSVQLLSNESNALRMCTEQQLLTRIIISLYSLLSNHLSQSGIRGTGCNTHHVVDCSSDLIRGHCYWPLISDLVNVITHRPIAAMFMNDPVLLDVWFELIGFLQGMNVNERELVQHVEYETDTYYASFSAEIEISCSPLWRILLHCSKSSFNFELVSVLKKSMAALSSWFDSIGYAAAPLRPDEYQISFHIPLHRYFAAFLCSAVLYTGFQIKAEVPEAFLRTVLMHPLQIQVAFYEIFAQMWVRNGLQIRGQAMTYTQCHFCNSLVDLDIYLLQVCGSYLPPDYFVQTLLSAFHVEHWNVPYDKHIKRTNIEPAQDDAMLEGFLTLLCMILCVRTYSGQPSEDILRREIVTLLCMSDRTYSQLCDSIPEKSGSNNASTDLKQLLHQVADFKAPGFNVSGKLQQGMYCPKGEIWLQEYDPLQTLLRTVHRREFQQSMDRYTEFVQRSNLFAQGQTPWPPLRHPNRPLDAYSGIYNLLKCVTTLKLCFNLLYARLNSKLHRVTDAALYLTVFLLQLMADLHEDSSEVKVGDKCAWFPCDNVIENMLHTVCVVTIKEQVHIMKDDSVAEDTVEGAMDTDFGEEQDVDDMFHIGRPRFDSRTLLDSRHGVVLRTRERVSAGSSGTPVIPHPFPRSSGSRTKPTDLRIDESIVSMLIKLHNRFSDRQGSYVPLTIRGDDLDSTKQVGGGPFYVSRLLDTICTKSAKYGQAVESIYSDLLPKVSEESTSMSAKKKRAQERQKKMMEKMTKMQGKFMEKIEQTMSKAELDKMMEPDAMDEAYVVVEQFECSICSSTTPSTNERPLGMVALVQSTSVLSYARSKAEPDRLCTNKTDIGLDTEAIYGSYFNRCNERLSKVFNDTNRNLSAIGVDRKSGVFIQSCGHYLHIDCYKAYQESVSMLARSRQNLNTDEYYCPLCRQLANTILPIVPTGSDSPLVVVPPKDAVQCVNDIHKMLLQKCDTGRHQGPLSQVLTAFKSQLLSNLHGDLKQYLKDNPSEDRHFLYSVARCNLDYMVLYEKNGIFVPSRKSCLAHLMSILTHHIKRSESVGSECLELLFQVSGVDYKRPSPNKSLMAQHGFVPFLLRDPVTVLIQLYLSLPPHLASGYFDRLVSILYNFAYVQALLLLSCKFSDDERQSWLNDAVTKRKSSFGRSSGAAQTNSGLELLQTIITQLKNVQFFPVSDVSSSFLECSIWSPLAVESFIQTYCLPLLEFAAVLKENVYNLKFNSNPLPNGNQDENGLFLRLCKFLGLINGSDASDSPSSVALNWMGVDAHTLVRGWLSFLISCKDQPTVWAYISDHVIWKSPKLLELPRQYDTLFQFYRSMACPKCGNVPAAPSVCLICGTFVCFKEICCTSHSGVSHSKLCGSGTSVILDINASIVAIIRGKRATLWGSVYLDEHGEEDRDLKRGKPLFLCKERYRMLEEQWLSHNFDYVCKRWIFHSDQL